jgi:hypothetical protein
MIPIILDNEATVDRLEPDAHGQAALLLAESILHALVETRTLSSAEAISVIDTTCSVKTEVAERAGESSKRMNESLALLKKILDSFKADLK